MRAWCRLCRQHIQQHGLWWKLLAAAQQPSGARQGISCRLLSLSHRSPFTIYATAGTLIYQCRTVRQLAAALGELLRAAASDKGCGSFKASSDGDSELGSEGRGDVGLAPEPQVCVWCVSDMACPPANTLCLGAPVFSWGLWLACSGIVLVEKQMSRRCLPCCRACPCGPPRCCSSGGECC